MSDTYSYISDAIAEDAIDQVDDKRYSQRLVVALIAAEITKSFRSESAVDPGRVFETEFEAVAKKLRLSE
jgi:hypothetical protein